MWTTIKLIATAKTVDDYGDIKVTETARSVMADDYSVGMSETYQAMAVGLRPEIKFKLKNWLDYQGEQLVEHKPFGSEKTFRYRVLRTFRNREALELTCYEGIERPEAPVPPVPPTPPEPEEPAEEEET